MESGVQQPLPEHRINADKTLVKLGENGTYQLSMFILINSLWFFCVFQILSVAFIGAKPDFACRNFKYESNPLLPGEFNDTCTVDVYNDTSIKCGNNGTFLEFDPTYGTSIVTEFHLVCDKNFLAESSASLFMFGIMVGDLLITSAADRFGRRWAYLGSLWAMGIFGCLASVAPTFVSFAICRFLTGCAYSGTIMVGWVLGCECVPAAMRAYGLVLMGVFWTAGYCLLGLLAYLVRSWRWLNFIISAQVLLTLPYVWLVPEGLHWLTANQKSRETMAWIRKAQKYNKVVVSLDDCFESATPDNLYKPVAKKRTIVAAFSNATLAWHTIGMSYLWICDTFVYYGLSLFSTNLGGDRYMDFVLSGAIELPAYFIVAPLLNRIGRRTVVGVSHALAGVALLVLMIVPSKTASGTDLQPLVIVLWLAGKFAITCAFCSIYVLGAELFPTTLRGSSMGFFGVISRIGGILAPFVGLMKEVSVYLPPALFGCSSLVGAVVTAFLPETLNHTLPEDIDEVYPSELCSFFFKRRGTKPEFSPIQSSETAELQSNSAVLNGHEEISHDD